MEICQRWEEFWNRWKKKKYKKNKLYPNSKTQKKLYQTIRVLLLIIADIYQIKDNTQCIADKKIWNYEIILAKNIFKNQRVILQHGEFIKVKGEMKNKSIRNVHKRKGIGGIV